jgi:hypothetical protein
MRSCNELAESLFGFMAPSFCDHNSMILSTFPPQIKHNVAELKKESENHNVEHIERENNKQEHTKLTILSFEEVSQILNESKQTHTETETKKKGK